MMIILTCPGGQKVRFNAEKVIHYTNETITLPQNEVVTGTKITLSTKDDDYFFVIEPPEEIDEMLRTNFVTVYEKK